MYFRYAVPEHSCYRNDDFSTASSTEEYQAELASQVEVSGSASYSGVTYSGSGSFSASVASQSFAHEVASTESTRFKSISYCLEAMVSFDQYADWSTQTISPSLARLALDLPPVSTMKPGTITLGVVSSLFSDSRFSTLAHLPHWGLLLSLLPYSRL